jgi:hypothetical protein
MNIALIELSKVFSLLKCGSVSTFRDQNVWETNIHNPMLPKNSVRFYQFKYFNRDHTECSRVLYDSIMAILEYGIKSGLNEQSGNSINSMNSAWNTHSGKTDVTDRRN